MSAATRARDAVNILDEFAGWAAAKTEALNASGKLARVQHADREAPKPSAYLEIEDDERLARVTLWANGECDAEIGYVNSDAFWAQRWTDLGPGTEFDLLLRDFLLKATERVD